jgi:N-acyl-D-aspartate/D-glutamate deacylase
MSHVRSEDEDQLQSSIKELLRQGEFARIHVAHLKSVYGHGSDSGEVLLKQLNDARVSGIDVTADIYPYNASFTGISIVFPIWAKTIDQFNVAKVKRRQELESFLRKKINRRNGPEATLLGTPPYTGKTLADLSREFEIPFEQVLIEKIGPQGAEGAYFVMDDELQTHMLLDPLVSISSDGRQTSFHPRGHGAFAKIIEEYVNQRQVLSLEEAVRKMTSQSAAILGITDRGAIQVGKKADIIIFEPEKIRARATYIEPHLLAEGFDIVIINGKIARRGDRMSELLTGEVLKPAQVMTDLP